MGYLSQFHHHMGKHMQEAHHSIPQTTVGQGLLVSCAGTLRQEDNLNTWQPYPKCMILEEITFKKLKYIFSKEKTLPFNSANIQSVV